MITTKRRIRSMLLVAAGIGLTLLSAQTYAIEKKVFYHNNLLGSPVAATDENGNLCWREDYRPYGEKIRNEDQGCGLDGNEVGYTGHVHDRDIGLTYMQARYYDPVVGRFMGVDAVGFGYDNTKSFNMYSYGNNNPYTYVDPSGKEVFSWAGQANANAGYSGSTATGGWVNLTWGGVGWGTFSSVEVGAAAAIPSAGAGFEISVFNTNDPSAALNGFYSIGGIDAGAVSGDVSVTLSEPGQNAVVGFQLSVDLTPTGATDIGGHYRTGRGVVLSSNFMTWGDLGRNVGIGFVSNVKKFRDALDNWWCDVMAPDQSGDSGGATSGSTNGWLNGFGDTNASAISP